MLTSWRKLAVRRRVVVNLKTGNAVRGILWSQRGTILELRHAEIFDPSTSRTTPVSGALLVERSNVDFIQTPEG